MELKPEFASVTKTCSVAEAYLAHLKRRGVDYLYVGAGTDTAPIVEAYARAGVSGLEFPVPILATHENLAVGMAHGYTMVTGRAQAVMLHVSVGAANAVCALMNAARAQIPMLFTAGRTPILEQGRLGARDSEIHWAQEMFDQAGMVRECVKWDYELRDGAQLFDVVDRALAITASDPRGPVYLTLPREVLASTMDESHGTAGPAQPRAASPAPDPDALAMLARALTTAQAPVIVCTGSGVDTRTPGLLAELADRFGIGVAEGRSRYVCFPAGHALHLGHDMAAVYARADALLYLESDVPWVPSKAAPAPGAFVAHAGTDPLFSRYPVRGHRSDLTITTGTYSLLTALLTALPAALEAAGARDHALTRGDRIRTWSGELKAGVARKIDAERVREGPITKAFLSRCVADALPADGIVVNEYPVVRDSLPFDGPGRYYVHPASAGLGWGLPAALGAQQASPGRLVVAMLGDGAYLFANPAACHHAAAMHKLPVVVIVFDNGGWEAVQNATLSVYPGSHSASASKAGMLPLASLDPTPDFRAYAQASGGLGLRVDTRAGLPSALAQAFAAAAAGQQALLHVVGKG